MPYQVTVTEHGSLFDGRFQATIAVYARHVESEIGEEAVNRIRHDLPEHYKYLGHSGGDARFNPVPPDAGFLESQIETHRERRNLVLVTSGNVIYGPWIEGIALGNYRVWPHKRNPPPRRFPGYHVFRLVSQELEMECADLAQRELPPYMGAINA
jgi:hypothetical protein